MKILIWTGGNILAGMISVTVTSLARLGPSGLTAMLEIFISIASIQPKDSSINTRYMENSR